MAVLWLHPLGGFPLSWTLCYLSACLFIVIVSNCLSAFKALPSVSVEAGKTWKYGFGRLWETAYHLMPGFVANLYSPWVTSYIVKTIFNMQFKVIEQNRLVLPPAKLSEPFDTKVPPTVPSVTCYLYLVWQKVYCSSREAAFLASGGTWWMMLISIPETGLQIIKVSLRLRKWDYQSAKSSSPKIAVLLVSRRKYHQTQSKKW